ncbi:MAG: hypothetical protein AAGD96_27220 [Chloroflexota bacterium]
MSWRTYNYNCDWCGLPCESTRSDARFCKGSKCRTAYGRREKKREIALQRMQLELSDETLASFAALDPFNQNDALKDMASKYGSIVVGQTIDLMKIVFDAVTQQKDSAIQRLEAQLEEAEKQAKHLDQIRDAINEVRPHSRFVRNHY